MKGGIGLPLFLFGGVMGRAAGQGLRQKEKTKRANQLPSLKGSAPSSLSFSLIIKEKERKRRAELGGLLALVFSFYCGLWAGLPANAPQSKEKTKTSKASHSFDSLKNNHPTQPHNLFHSSLAVKGAERRRRRGEVEPPLAELLRWGCGQPSMLHFSSFVFLN